MEIPHPKYNRSKLKKPTKSVNTMLQIKLPNIEKLKLTEEEVTYEKVNIINLNATDNLPPKPKRKNSFQIKSTNKYHLDINNSDKIPKKYKHSYSVLNYEDIIYLNRKSEVTQMKIAKEFQAQNYIEDLKEEIKKKEELRNKVIKELHNLYRKKDDNKLKLSLDLDNKLDVLYNLKEKLEKSYNKKTKYSLINNRNIYHDTNNKTTKLEKDIINLINDNKVCDEKFAKLGEDFYKEYLTLNDHIIQLENELKENIESGTKYYLLLLNKGNDTRKIGLSWIVRRLLQLKYEPTLKDFPKNFDEKMVKFVIDLAKKQNENIELIEQLKRMKDEMISNQEKYEETNNKNISGLKEQTEKHLYEKLEQLLEKHEYYCIPPQQENKIQICLHNPNIKKYQIKLKENDNISSSFIKNRSSGIKSRAHSASSSFGTWKYNSIIFNEKNLVSQGRIKELRSIIDIKKKIEMNEYTIEKLKIKQYNYLREKKKKSHCSVDANFLKNDNLMKSLFGSRTNFYS